MSGYGGFAYFYDRLMSNVDYDRIAAFIDSHVMRCSGRRGILLDLACGTGTLCEKMAGLGYDVIGIDSSMEMLNAALDKKFESGLAIQYLRQDMRRLDMFGTIDVTVCTLDGINHLPQQSDIMQTFERVSLFAEPQGLFIFDVNTIYKHRQVLANNAFIYDLGDLYCGWQNEYEKSDNSVNIYLDFFEKTPQGYERFSESFKEIAVSGEEIKKMLSEAGFEILGVYDGYSEAAAAECSEREVYVCRKN